MDLPASVHLPQGRDREGVDGSLPHVPWRPVRRGFQEGVGADCWVRVRVRSVPASLVLVHSSSPNRRARVCDVRIWNGGNG